MRDDRVIDFQFPAGGGGIIRLLAERRCNPPRIFIQWEALSVCGQRSRCELTSDPPSNVEVIVFHIVIIKQVPVTVVFGSLFLYSGS